MSHTPGPWTLRDEPKTDAGYWSVWGANQQFICHFSRMTEEGMPSTAANARLIAAAPDLLETVERLLTTMDTALQSLAKHGESSAWLRVLLDARAVVAKVKGAQ